MKINTGDHAAGDAVHKRYHLLIAISNIVLCTVGVIGVLLVMFVWIQRYIGDEMAKMSITQLSNTAQSIESQLDYYQMQLQNLFQEPQIRTSLYTEEKSAIHEFGIYRFLNYSIANDGIIDYALIYKEGEIKQFVGSPYPTGEELALVTERLNNTSNDREIFRCYDEKTGKGRLFVFRTERNVLNGPPIRGIVFAVNHTRLVKSLLSDQGDAANQNMWVFDSEGDSLISHADHLDVEPSVVWNTICQLSETKDTNDSGEMKIEDRTFDLTCFKGTEYQLYFAKLTSKDEIADTIRQMLITALISAFVVLLICSAAAFLLARFILKPLRKFFRGLTDSAGLTERIGENEQLVQVTSERILSEISSMSRQLHTDKVMSYLEDSDQDAEPPKWMRLHENGEAAVIAYIGSKIGKIHRGQLEGLKERLQRIMPEWVHADIYSDENRVYGVMIARMEKENAGTYLGKPKWMAPKMEELFWDIDMTEGALYIVYSGLVNDAVYLQSEFRRLKELAKYVLFGDFSGISCITSYETKLDAEILKESFEEIISVIKSGDDVKAKSKMPELLNRMSKYEIKRVFHALSCLAVDIEQIYYQFSDHSRDLQRAYMEHYIKLTSLINQKGLYDYFSNLIEDACLEIRTAKERSLRSTMLDSIKYIEEHFTDPELSVEQLATIFHISNSYFSRMFNEICKISFPEYVSELRLNYSAQLLATTNLSVKEVSSRSGFSGVSYFGAQFKKKFGVSPTAYRGKRAK